MKRAWKLFKAKNVRTMEMFSMCLRESWAIAKIKSVHTYEEVHAKYYDEIKGWLNSKVNKETAEDLTQNTFIKIYENIKYYDPNKSGNSGVRGWIFGYARNTLYDHFRTEKESRMTMLSSYEDEDGRDNSPVPVTNVEDEIGDVEVERIVRKIIRTAPELSDNERQIGILRVNRKFQYKDIAESLELPMGTVKGLMNRLKNKLKPKFDLLHYELS